MNKEINELCIDFGDNLIIFYQTTTELEMTWEEFLIEVEQCLAQKMPELKKLNVYE